MELALIIIAGFGVLLFLYSYLAYVFAGFKHHPVTGIISTLPVLNIVTLPSLWHKTGRKLIIGIIGLILAGGTWALGADKGFNNLLAMAQGRVGVNVASENIEATPVNSSTRQHLLDESNMEGLPSKALYRMAFEVVPANNISTLQGRIVRIATNNAIIFEGRVKNVSAGSVFLEVGNTLEHEVPLANIKQLSLMVKKAK